MRVANPYLVSAVLEPFLFLGADAAEAAASIDPSNEAEIRNYIRQLLVPYFSRFDEESKLLIKDSLGYMLSQGSDKWENLFSMNQSPLALPDPPEKFFEWLWDELFGKTPHLDGPIENYIFREDIYAPNLINRTAK
jgi:hypothetical protein